MLAPRFLASILVFIFILIAELCWVLIRFIATIIRVSDIRVNNLELMQLRVRAKYRLKVA